MFHIVQENTFNERNYDNLTSTLDYLNLEYEVIKVLPFIESIDFKTDRKDVFVWGAVKLARIAKQYNWHPGSLLNNNHNFLVYKDYYKDNLFNYNSKIIKITDDYDYPNAFFARPTKDSKVFTGQEFLKDDFLNLKERVIDMHPNQDIDIQISGIKRIFKEIRFWIVKGKIITASQYKLGFRVVLDEIIDDEAHDFVNKMINIFQLADAFVMDICLGEDGWKIMECGCINCAGFYKANMQKLVMALEDAF